MLLNTLVLVMLADVITGFCGVDLPINEFTYNSFVIVTLGSFGIAGIEKFAKTSYFCNWMFRVGFHRRDQ